MHCLALLQQALPRLGGRRSDFSLVLSVLTPGKEKTGGDESRHFSLRSAHRVRNDRGIPFTEPRYSHGITSAHQGYIQIGDLHISYPAYRISALNLVPYLFPCTAGCAELSPAETTSIQANANWWVCFDAGRLKPQFSACR